MFQKNDAHGVKKGAITVERCVVNCNKCHVYLNVSIYHWGHRYEASICVYRYCTHKHARNISNGMNTPCCFEMLHIVTGKIKTRKEGERERESIREVWRMITINIRYNFVMMHNFSWCFSTRHTVLDMLIAL